MSRTTKKLCRGRTKLSQRWTSVLDSSKFELCIISLIFFILVPLLSAEISSQSFSENHRRHRLHHGDDHSRQRLRRFGRESSQPVMESYVISRVTEPYAAYKYEETHTSRIAVENLNKPNFTRCASYEPEIYEGQPINTSVIQVEAVDQDPPTSGGSVMYSIVEVTTDDFNVDPHTGWVRTKKIFDRDEPSREKQVYVTVRATDNGRPQLDSVCTMRVKILDINDNKPMFDKYEYKESIPRDLPIQQVVMRISATDIDDGLNGTVQYGLERHPQSPGDLEYFDIVPKNGEVRLKAPIPESKAQFYLTAIANDLGNPQLSSATNLTVLVVEPNRKPPEFVEAYPNLIELPEKTVDSFKPILALNARSNTPDGIIFFELVNGQTQPTNKDATFTLESSGNTAHLKLDRALDYESVSEYTLTIRASNKYNLATETVITVKVIDENDEKPYFTEVDSGSVLENEPAGTTVMRVRAIDNDGTSPNNEVTYYLKDEDRVNFHIDSYSGEITTRKQFDREEHDLYQLTVIARDGAASVLTNNGQPNERPVPLKIVIADKNDNRPVFMKDEYEAEVAEDANTRSKVIEVRAMDNDTASIIAYHITSGDPAGYFGIESTSSSGVIFIQDPLDYEKIQKYELTVRASDGLYDAVTKVIIKVTNVNDNLPVFEKMERNTTIREETKHPGCIFRLRAYDPDISDRSAPQNITFFIEKGTEHFSVDNNGCVMVIKGLDRDPPNGYGFPLISIGASDENGIGSTKQTSVIQLTVTLTDINDNAPFLTNTNPVVWMENQAGGEIIQLSADDHDTQVNGPPFTFYIDPSADAEILRYFTISGDRERGHKMNAVKDMFDREEQKQYLVPIVITDDGSPQQTGTSTLVVIIGDENDNPMRPGESKIFIYKYKETKSFSIGRVYVEDLDDWDLPDKTFSWLTSEPPDFTLDIETGMINMKPSAPVGTSTLKFKVRDTVRMEEVTALVHVTVKQITDEAVDNSGSIRFRGVTKEEFVMPNKNGKSKQDVLKAELAQILGVPEENIDIFTVINSPHVSDPNILDVRYSAHNSPYYKSDKLDGIVAQNKNKLEAALGVEIMMIKIDECIVEKIHCEASCTNRLTKSDISYKIYTNTSSFVGVNAYLDPICTCSSALAPHSCDPNPCLNQGICHSGPTIQGFKCDCVEGFHGPRCEQTSVSFEGTGYAWYHPLSVCNDSSLQVYFTTPIEDGLIFYNGPLSRTALNVTDFISLELLRGRPVFLIDYGSGVERLELPAVNLADAKAHKITLRWTAHEISMKAGDCPMNDQSCFAFKLPTGSNSFLNVNGPLQLGGLSIDLQPLRASMGWQYIPVNKMFTGCISNLSLNGEYYNLGTPSFAIGNVSSCDSPFVLVQTATLGPGMNFLIILIVCIVILLTLIIAIVCYRRGRSYEEVKGDPHDDVRENIINYDDEGGGEEDKATYDLSVLQKASNGGFIPSDKIPLEDMRQRRAPETDGPDIQSFLQANKNKVDEDPDGLPFDDVRNYAYEGDGNSVGSLSSLASATDDEDLNFDYLPTFGPRFKKLADMYGGQSSDDESYTGGTEAWC